jgi:hypothetical protein
MYDKINIKKFALQPLSVVFHCLTRKDGLSTAPKPKIACQFMPFVVASIFGDSTMRANVCTRAAEPLCIKHTRKNKF